LRPFIPNWRTGPQ